LANKKGIPLRKGFTLIEMMIVIAIIGIIAGFAIPNVTRMRIAGNISKAKGDLRALQSALENYYIHQNNTYPSELKSLTSATPRIIYTLPKDPFASANDYGYSLSKDGSYYVIYSVGQNVKGVATINEKGDVAEVDPAACIYVSNAQEDSQP
jgi:general secretion pathway protein G